MKSLYDVFVYSCLLNLPCFGQITDHIVYKQQLNPIYKLAIEEKDYTNSVILLKEAEKKYGQLFAEEYLLWSYCEKNLNNNQSSAEFLKKSCIVNSFDMRSMWDVPELNFQVITNGYNEHQLQLRDEGFERWSERRAKDADSLISVIDSMTYWEQHFRSQWSNDKENPKFQMQLDSIDTQNRFLLEKMVLENGFPGEWKLQLSEFCIWFILVHSAEDEDFYQRMKPVFFREVKEGRMSPWMYASWMDQYQFYNNLPTLYNTQIGLYPNLSQEEREVISKNRHEIGLVDLEFRRTDK